MAEFLGIDRNLCQRVLAAAKSDGLAFLAQTPSPAQLQRLVEGAGLKGFDADRLSGLRSAIDAYSEAVLQSEAAPGAFRRRIKELLERSHSETADSGQTFSPLETLHRAAVGVAGCELEARVNLALMWPRSDIRMGVNVLMFQGHVGYSAGPRAMPMVVQFADWKSNPDGTPLAESMFGEAGTESRRVLLHDFCSSPLPKLVPSGSADSCEHVIELQRAETGERATVFTAIGTVQDPHPLLDELDRIRSFNAHMRLPSRRFLFDVFLHRSLASACVPSAAVKAWSPNIHLNPAGDWANVIPGGPRLELLPPNINAMTTDAWDRHLALIQRGFALAAKDPSEFVGYRLDAHMPVWGAHYVIAFDFTHAPQAVISTPAARAE